MKTAAALAFLICASTLASPAAAYSARNGFTVQALAGGNFQVMSRGGLSAQNAWCAAGDYAMSVLGVQPGAQIWRISQPPRPRAAAIVFSLSSVGAATSTGLLTLGGGGGASMAAVSARNQCVMVNVPGMRG